MGHSSATEALTVLPLFLLVMVKPWPQLEPPLASYLERSQRLQLYDRGCKGYSLGRVEGDDVVAVAVPPATGAEADLEVGSLTGVGDALLDVDLSDGGGEGERGSEGEESGELEHFGNVCVGLVRQGRRERTESDSECGVGV